MSPADKRRVFREIDDNWDEAKGRYLGGISDSVLATKLNVPRAWIVSTRIEAFGESQRNEDTDKLLGDLKNLKGEVNRNSAAALELAGKFEANEKALDALIAKVEKIA